MISSVNGRFAVFSLDEIGTLVDAKIGRMIECEDKRKRKSMLKDISRNLPSYYAPKSDLQADLVSISTGCDSQGNLVVVANYEISLKKKPQREEADANPI